MKPEIKIIPSEISKKISHTMLEMLKQITDSQISSLNNLLETTDYFRNYSIVIAESFNPILDSINALNRIDKSLRSISNNLVEYLKTEIINIDAISNTILDSPYMKSLFTKIEYSENIKKAFINAGWPISSSIPKKVQERVIELNNSNRIGYASNIIIGYFKRNNYKHLKNLLERWRGNKYYLKRKKLLNEALDNHLRGNYHSSISVLLQCIEGIITDFVVENNIILSKIDSPIEKSKAIVGDLNNYDFSNYVIARIFFDYAQGSLYNYTSFKDEIPKSENKKIKNRHTISHGITSEYGSTSSSLKYFIVLDAVLDIIEANSNI
ncbi:MAG: hypothetical protein ACYC59_02775 [Anaerolineaceae bacterium]